MSDDDKEIDIESDCEEEDDGSGSIRSGSEGNHANKRAHHNALERKRRDHIKDSFTSLRDCVPALQGEKVSQSSRAQILKKASDYIDFMRKKISSHQTDIEDLLRQNQLLEVQIKSLEKAKYTGNFAAMSSATEDGRLGQEYVTNSDSEEEEEDGGAGDSDEEEAEEVMRARRKRMRS